MHETHDAGSTTLRGAWGELGFHTLGAIVTSWRPRGKETLYLAPGERPTFGEMPHGGIPVCAPWFGVGAGEWDAPFTHGLVSRVRWTLVDQHVDDDSARAVLTTDAQATSHLPGADRFPDDLRYELAISADATRLTLGLTIASPSRAALVEAAFHPYLLTDAPSAEVRGLEGVGYTDFSHGTTGVADGPIRIETAPDAVFDAAPATQLTDARGEVRLAAQGAHSVIVWNPGPGGTSIPGDEWRRFACVEYGYVKGRAILIPAGGSHLLRLTVLAD